jgi:hypothetical protein
MAKGVSMFIERKEGKALVVVYKGIKFRRYPKSKSWSDRMYYMPEHASRKQGVDRLHREIWKDYYGGIPEGNEIHHRDGNPLNNDPGNLECLLSVEHNDHHKEQYTEAQRNSRRKWFLEKVRPQADSWHRSAAGRAWHSKHGKNTWKKREVYTINCLQCGAAFKTKLPDHTRFCSDKCRARARYESGIDNENRVCKRCKKSFEVNKYQKKEFCSRSCGSRYWREKTAGLQPDG